MWLLWGIGLTVETRFWLSAGVGQVRGQQILFPSGLPPACLLGMPLFQAHSSFRWAFSFSASVKTPTVLITYLLAMSSLHLSAPISLFSEPLSHHTIEHPLDGQSFYVASIFFFFQFIWLSRVLAAACRNLTESRGISRCGPCALWLSRGLWGAQASAVAVLCLRCSAACGILVPWQGIKPTSPALQGEFLTTGPPRKSLRG